MVVYPQVRRQGCLVHELAAHPGVEQVIGVDEGAAKLDLSMVQSWYCPRSFSKGARSFSWGYC